MKSTSPISIDYKIHIVGSGTLFNTQNNIVIDASAGNDDILNGTMEDEDDYEVITGGEGNDLIRNLGNATTLDGGTGNHEGNVGYIEDDEFTGTVSGGDNALITGGDGNDQIISRGDKSHYRHWKTAMTLSETVFTRNSTTTITMNTNAQDI